MEPEAVGTCCVFPKRFHDNSPIQVNPIYCGMRSQGPRVQLEYGAPKTEQVSAPFAVLPQWQIQICAVVFAPGWSTAVQAEQGFSRW